MPTPVLPARIPAKRCLPIVHPIVGRILENLERKTSPKKPVTRHAVFRIVDARCRLRQIDRCASNLPATTDTANNAVLRYSKSVKHFVDGPPPEMVIVYFPQGPLLSASLALAPLPCRSLHPQQSVVNSSRSR